MDWGDFLLEFAFGITSSQINDVSNVEWHKFYLRFQTPVQKLMFKLFKLTKFQFIHSKPLGGQVSFSQWSEFNILDIVWYVLKL